MMFSRAFLSIYAGGAASNLAAIERHTGHVLTRELFEPLTWALAEMGRGLNAGDYVLAVQELQLCARAVARFFLTYDLWLTPVLAEPPLPLGALDAPPEEPLRGFFRAADYCPFTPICNATGQPAMSVPLTWNAAGVPIGSHFVARYGAEATLIRLAAQLEAARPWADRRPPVSA
jgi:amidase